jgi:hypothetical protein
MRNRTTRKKIQFHVVRFEPVSDWPRHVSLALVGAAAPCSASVITFEGFPDLTVFTTQDFGSGVTFAGATILSLPGSLNPAFPPHSGHNVVYNPSGAMTLNFTTAVDFFSGFFTYNLPLVIQAYDNLNNLLDTANGACAANYVGSGCSPNEFLQVDAIGAIAKVVISGGGGNNFTLDDAAFTGSRDPGLPEPATMAMLLGGLGALGLSRRRRAAAL